MAYETVIASLLSLRVQGGMVGTQQCKPISCLELSHCKIGVRS